MEDHMDDADHEALGAMLHRGKVEETTKGRDYHNEIVAALKAERDNYRLAANNLADELATEKSAHAECVDKFLAVSAELAAARDRAERHADALRLVSDQCGEYQRVIADLKLERDALIKAVAKIRPMGVVLDGTKES